MRTESDTSLTTPEGIVELSNLYDWYGVLFKKDQQDIFEDYVYENLSLGELSEKYNMTRQGIYDKINRIRKKLRDYEEKLRMIEREKKTISIISGAQIDPAEKERILAEIDEI